MKFIHIALAGASICRGILAYSISIPAGTESVSGETVGTTKTETGSNTGFSDDRPTSVGDPKITDGAKNWFNPGKGSRRHAHHHRLHWTRYGFRHHGHQSHHGRHRHHHHPPHSGDSNGDSGGRWFEPYCHLPGQVCSKLKRAVDLAWPILAEPNDTPEDHPCNSPGEACFKAKRHVEDLSKAVKKANTIVEREAETEPTWFRRYCHLPGQECSKAKRAAMAILEVLDGDSDDDGFAEDIGTTQAIDEQRQAAGRAIADMSY